VLPLLECLLIRLGIFNINEPGYVAGSRRRGLFLYVALTVLFTVLLIFFFIYCMLVFFYLDYTLKLFECLIDRLTCTFS